MENIGLLGQIKKIEISNGLIHITTVGNNKEFVSVGKCDKIDFYNITCNYNTMNLDFGATIFISEDRSCLKHVLTKEIISKKEAEQELSKHKNHKVEISD